jgi:hypothetical protein
LIHGRGEETSPWLICSCCPTLVILLIEGQMSDYKGAALMLSALPHRIENMFGRRKDWRRIHTRCDRCAHTYFSAICVAAVVVPWL